MTATSWSVVGLVLNLGGVLMLFQFGMPYRTRRGGSSRLLREDVDKADKRQERTYSFMGWVGIALVVIGTAFQILGAVLA